VKTSWESVTVDNSPMRLYLCQPEGTGSAVLFSQHHDCGAPAATFCGSILEGKNPWMLLENAAHDVALDTDSTAVNDSNFLESRLATLLKIFFHNARDVLWMKRMEIDKVF